MLRKTIMLKDSDPSHNSRYRRGPLPVLQADIALGLIEPVRARYNRFAVKWRPLSLGEAIAPLASRYGTRANLGMPPDGALLCPECHAGDKNVCIVQQRESCIGIAMVDIQDTIFGFIAKQAKVDASTLTRETRFSDLKVDSLDVVEVIFQIEETFDISIPYNVNDTSADGISLDTLGEVTDLVDKLVNKADNRGAA